MPLPDVRRSARHRQAETLHPPPNGQRSRRLQQTICENRIGLFVVGSREISVGDPDNLDGTDKEGERRDADSPPILFKAIYWFIPLNDHLGIPSKNTFRFPVERDAVEKIEFLARNRELVDKFPEVLHTARMSSILVWQISESDAINRNSAALIAARRAFPGSHMIEDSEPAPNDAQHNAFGKSFTVLEVACHSLDGSEILEEELPNLLREIVDNIQSIQIGYSMVTGLPVQLLTVETLPHIIPSVRATIQPPGTIKPDNEIMMNIVNNNIFDLISRPELDEGGIQDLIGVVQRRGTAFTGSAESMCEAKAAFILRGDYRSAALAAATSAEIFIEDLIKHLLWEGGKTPEECVNLYTDQRQSALSRSKRHLPELLGGSWQDDRPGAMRAWQEKSAKLRHRVIHAGYHPDRSETQAAIDAVLGFQDHAIDALRKKRNKYPRTALALIGVERLQAEGLISPQIQGIIDSDLSWIGRFTAWRACLARQIEAASGLAEQPDPNRSELVVVVHPGRTEWVLHDRTARMAARAEIDPRLLPEAQRGVLARALAAMGTVNEPVSILVERGPTPRLTEAWVAEHRRIPLAKLMVAGGDMY